MRLLTAIVFAVVPATAVAQTPLRLHALFGDHMVLPQKTNVPLRGIGAPGAQVQVTAPWIDGPVTGAIAADGHFRIDVATPPAGGPFEVTVQCGAEQRVLHDVLIGDVWLGSGQSNMEMPVGNEGGWQGGVKDWEKECAAADLPQVRLFTVAQRIAAAPLDDVVGEWRVCTPKSARAFSATAFFFGRDVYARRHEPLGLVVSSWGGTVCEAWTSRAALTPFAEFGGAIGQLDRQTKDTRTPEQQWAAWWSEAAAKDPVRGGRRPEQSGYDDADWSSVPVPQKWSKAGLGDFDGVGWYRTTVTVPASWVGKQLIVSLGPIDDMDEAWFDGVRIGGAMTPGHWNEPRRYEVPAASVRAGEIVLAVRVLDTSGEGGFGGDAESLRVFPVGGEAGGIGLAKSWRFQRGTAMSSLPATPHTMDGDPNVPTVLWNGMLAPLLPFPFRGALWYQGESNRGRDEQYARLFPAMIADWRRVNGSSLPFYFVQIAPYEYGGDHGETFTLRLAQAAALQLPDVQMAVTTDIGEARDIHPKDKQSVGRRLARLALKHTYNDATVVDAAPAPARATIADGAVRVTFAHAEGGLRTAAGGPRHFEVAGADGVFHAVTATVDGDAVLLRGDGAATASAVRYCFATAAMADLWNRFDLPPAPFALRVDGR